VRENASQVKLRRMVKYKDPKVHLAEVNVPPQWMQWLRHTREAAPTVEEQSLDVFRQRQLKQLAAAADARWAAQDSFLVAPSVAKQVEQQDEQAWRAVDGSNSRLDEAARKMGILDEATEETPRPIESRTSQTKETPSKISQPSPWNTSPKPKDEPDAWTPKAVQR
jgi:NADH dehydrogenase [ubiquinone] 1 alpha subcomplex assembly factor 2